MGQRSAQSVFGPADGPSPLDGFDAGNLDPASGSCLTGAGSSSHFPLRRPHRPSRVTRAARESLGAEHGRWSTGTAGALNTACILEEGGSDLSLTSSSEEGGSEVGGSGQGSPSGVGSGEDRSSLGSGGERAEGLGRSSSGNDLRVARDSLASDLSSIEPRDLSSIEPRDTDGFRAIMGSGFFNESESFPAGDASSGVELCSFGGRDSVPTLGAAAAESQLGRESACSAYHERDMAPRFTKGPTISKTLGRCTEQDVGILYDGRGTSSLAITGSVQESSVLQLSPDSPQLKSSSKSSVAPKVIDRQLCIEVLGVCEFTSARKRMSVILRVRKGALDAKGRSQADFPEQPSEQAGDREKGQESGRQSSDIFVFTKGGDSVMLERGAPPYTDPETHANMGRRADWFAEMGARTLCYGVRKLSEAEFDAWQRAKSAQSLGMNAATGTENLPSPEGAAAASPSPVEEDPDDLIESGLTLVGVVAIEDKLATGVAETVECLRRAQIPVWVCTGDKIETAVAVALSCRIARPEWDHLELRSVADLRLLPHFFDLRGRGEEGFVFGMDILGGEERFGGSSSSGLGHSGGLEIVDAAAAGTAGCTGLVGAGRAATATAAAAAAAANLPRSSGVVSGAVCARKGDVGAVELQQIAPGKGAGRVTAPVLSPAAEKGASAASERFRKSEEQHAKGVRASQGQFPRGKPRASGPASSLGNNRAVASLPRESMTVVNRRPSLAVRRPRGSGPSGDGTDGGQQPSRETSSKTVSSGAPAANPRDDVLESALSLSASGERFRRGSSFVDVSYRRTSSSHSFLFNRKSGAVEPLDALMGSLVGEAGAGAAQQRGFERGKNSRVRATAHGADCPGHVDTAVALNSGAGCSPAGSAADGVELAVCGVPQVSREKPAESGSAGAGGNSANITSAAVPRVSTARSLQTSDSSKSLLRAIVQHAGATEMSAAEENSQGGLRVSLSSSVASSTVERNRGIEGGDSSRGPESEVSDLVNARDDAARNIERAAYPSLEDVAGRIASKPENHSVSEKPRAGAQGVSGSVAGGSAPSGLQQDEVRRAARPFGSFRGRPSAAEQSSGQSSGVQVPPEHRFVRQESWNNSNNILAGSREPEGAQNEVPDSRGERGVNLNRSGTSSTLNECYAVLGGDVLAHLLGAENRDEILERYLTKFTAVVCCRVSPRQKNELVKYVASEDRKVLAIGDGANDVDMIKQATVGVGTPLVDRQVGAYMYARQTFTVLEGGHVVLEVRVFQ